MSDEIKSALQSTARGASIFTIGRVASQLLGFVFNAILTNYLGPVGYGIITYADTAMMTVLNIADLGADKALLRFLPDDDPDEREQTLGLAGLSVVVAGVGSGIGLYVAAPLISSYTISNESFIFVLRVMAFVLPFRALTKIAQSGFRALERPAYQLGISEGLLPVSRLAAALLSVGLGLAVEGIATALLVSTVILAIVALSLFFSKTGLRPRSGATTERISRFYSYSLPLTVNSAGSYLVNNVDLLMVGLLGLGSAAVGQYRAAALMTTAAALPLSGINQIFPARASQLFDRGLRDELDSLYKTVTRWAITATLPIAAGLVVYRAPLLSLLGSEFVTAQLVLAVLLIRRLSDAGAGPCGYLLMMTDHERLITINNVVLGLSNVVLNIVLIAEFGVIGAAIATAASVTVFNFVKMIEVWWIEGHHPYSRKLLKPLSAGVVCTSLMLFVREATVPVLLNADLVRAVAGGMVGVLGFVVVIILLGLEESDKSLMRSIR
jgi:O-antigen/teichoic acid export membrane protein